jgi:hypothetical protein
LPSLLAKGMIINAPSESRNSARGSLPSRPRLGEPSASGRADRDESALMEFGILYISMSHAVSIVQGVLGNLSF